MSPHKRVFAVDDDEAVLKSLLAIMRWHGYDAQGFLSAEEFLRQTPLHEPGCVVADLQLPGIDGLELQQRLLRRNASSAEQRYAHFVQHHPGLAARVPNVHVASYLGVTPEFLSWLRAKMSKRG